MNDETKQKIVDEYVRREMPARAAGAQVACDAIAATLRQMAAALPMPEHPGPLSEREQAIAVYAQHEALAVVVKLLADFQAGIARRHGVGDDR